MNRGLAMSWTIGLGLLAGSIGVTITPSETTGEEMRQIAGLFLIFTPALYGFATYQRSVWRQTNPYPFRRLSSLVFRRRRRARERRDARCDSDRARRGLVVGVSPGCRPNLVRVHQAHRHRLVTAESAGGGRARMDTDELVDRRKIAAGSSVRTRCPKSRRRR